MGQTTTCGIAIKEGGLARLATRPPTSFHLSTATIPTIPPRSPATPWHTVLVGRRQSCLDRNLQRGSGHSRARQSGHTSEHSAARSQTDASSLIDDRILTLAPRPLRGRLWVGHGSGARSLAARAARLQSIIVNEAGNWRAFPERRADLCGLARGPERRPPVGRQLRWGVLIGWTAEGQG